MMDQSLSVNSMLVLLLLKTNGDLKIVHNAQLLKNHVLHLKMPLVHVMDVGLVTMFMLLPCQSLNKTILMKTVILP